MRKLILPLCLLPLIVFAGTRTFIYDDATAQVTKGVLTNSSDGGVDAVCYATIARVDGGAPITLFLIKTSNTPNNVLQSCLAEFRDGGGALQ